MNEKAMATMKWNQMVEKVGSISGNRRTDRRYGLRLDLRWKLIRRRKILECGLGQTIDFSSGGILVETNGPLPVDFNVELSITWPALLRDVTKLQLVVSGRVVRSEGNRAAIRIVQHEFRTVGTPVEAREPVRAAIHTALDCA